jgi:2-octaprenyl-6-methoxyphenol hydroxylase
MTKAPQEFDVLIAGGGLVGGSLAIALSSAGCRVALAEAVPPDSSAQPSFDDRSIALSRGSYRILKQLGVWPLLEKKVWPVRKIHVSERGRFGTAMLDAKEQGIPELGFVIKSRDLGAALWERLGRFPSLKIFSPARVIATAIDSDTRTVDIEVDGEHATVSTALLAVADGARSTLRDALEISATVSDYSQVAIVANVLVDERYTGNTAFERFTPDGPLAILPGPDGNYTAVLAHHSESVDDAMELSDPEFLALLQQNIGFRLGRLRQVGMRNTYPLQLVAASRVTAPRAVIVGNAAHGLHPVAAQGFNLGLRDVACLAELIADQHGADPGHPLLLDRYTDWRSSDQLKVVRFTDGLIRLFGAPGKAASISRGLALSAFDLNPAAKKELARQTMGLTGRLSRLARGLSL